jgi:16S rRNA C967 or C1407 C5-methylase (RsmB/RsmF family)/NOL1/NOP2/fmu family ribosome biogenesis protein
MIHPRFKEYFETTFFGKNPSEFQEFLNALEQPIPRTIRIKPGKEKQVQKNLENDGWILTETEVERVFSLDRRADFNPLERRIGFSLDHLLGNFYIQELAAAHPVDILANHEIHSDKFLILDMASSPGGKTTQLAEMYPNSFIVANEPTRERIPQLLQNLERMYTPNVWVTLYPGQFWKKFGETFDRILLDAPCSGEWTLYKWTDATKHWHLKNIKQIATLQEKLLDASIHALKVNGEMIYSTCSMNLLENEWVVQKIVEKYPWVLEILYEKRFWPHKEKTGGFFVIKIRKIQSIETLKEQKENDKHPNESLRIFRGNIGKFEVKAGLEVYEHENKILTVKNEKNVRELGDICYFMRFGERIGYRDSSVFHPNAFGMKSLESSKNMETYILKSEIELDNYLRGNPIESIWDDTYCIIQYANENISIEERKNNLISNSFPKEWQRK